MLAAYRKRIDREDEGFTLIELMVVVLIIAILLAIAIPTFLGARERAQDRAAQSNVRNAFTAEKVFFTDNQQYSQVPTSMAAIETSVSFVTASPASTGNQVRIMTQNIAGTDQAIVCLTAKSASGRFYQLKDISSGTSAGTSYADGTTTDPSGTCTTSPLTGKW